MPSDRELLLQYARQGGEAEFAELVRRHADFVYSVALRVTCNSALAQDVTQVVFTQLGRQAGQLGNYHSLVGWLHTAARRRAIDAVRTEERRRAREQEATAMQQNSATPEPHWAEISPLLDEAVGSLREPDRDAVLLRFFKNLSHQEVGAALGLGEDAARKRVDRALDKLREHFARRGVTASSALLAATIAENSVQAAPVGLAANITTTSLASVGSVAAGGASLMALCAFFMNTKSKIALAAAFFLVLMIAILVGRKSSHTQPITAAANPSPAPKIAALPAINVVAQVVAPTAKAAPIADVTVTPDSAAPAAPVNPRLELDTAMKDFVRLLESGDYVAAAGSYMQIPPTVPVGKFVEGLESNPDFPNTVRMLIESTKAAQTVAPIYDETGTLASYVLVPPVENKSMVRWKKINGQWYVDAFE